MPIYEYQCQACHEQLEVLQKMADAPLLECPKCGKPELRKKVSAAAFRLKGSGWYETDFKTGNKKNLAAGSDGSGGNEKPAATGSGDSKTSESKTSESKPKSSDSKSGDGKKTA